ncbi:ATP-binding protein [Marinilabiliaceae bacterium ANBcel2]|nr:ATP-binding protein [Marinilabiliaceae bacterium ANBcel2]
MIFNSFRVGLISRVIILTILIAGFVALLMLKDLVFTTILLGLLSVVQVVNIIRFVDRTNKLMNNFLQSVRYSDFSKSFEIESKSSSLDELKETLNEVIADFRSVRHEREESYHYLQTIIQHIGIALIAYSKDGSVELLNNATKKLFQIRNLDNIVRLKQYSSELVKTLLTIKHGEKALVKIREKDDILQLSIYATAFKIHNRNIMLVSIKNIQFELDEKEMESWQKLIRVLTHEIMNSITPISSLSTTVKGVVEELTTRVDDFEGCEFVKEELCDVKGALETIHRRTDGLIYFVNTYRNLTRIPEPHFSIFKIKDLLNTICDLHSDEFIRSGVEVKVEVEPDSLELSADLNLIEQVLINLVKNALYSLKERENARLILRSYLNRRGRVNLQVEDNGMGILPEVLDKIFIPFFSTKSSGSGIGLSLSRQIMRLHSGTINVYSKPEKGTTVTMVF